MKRKFPTGYQVKHKKIILLLLISLIVIAFTASPTITYAMHFVASVSVPPYYKIHAQDNNLYIKTNMTLYINNKKITYDR